MRRHKYRGFTLLELLVVVFTIGLLAAFLLPAVQSARESARRLKCLANLKQIGLATNAYLSTFDCFPTGGFIARNANRSVRRNGDFGPHARLLGHLDQQSLFNGANFQVACINDSYGVLANMTVTTTRLDVFLCPSSSSPAWSMHSAGKAFRTKTAPGNTYFASVGSSLEIRANRGLGSPNGVFPLESKAMGIRNITDGTSNTIAFGEWKIGSGDRVKVSIPTDIVFLGQYPPNVTRFSYKMSMPAGASEFEQWLPLCAKAIESRRTLHTPALGQDWAFGLMSNSLGNVLLPPNPKYPNCSTSSIAENSIQRPGMMGLSSNHIGGANALMCDGSVHFVKDSTNMVVIWSLGSRAQGELFSQDAF